MTQEELLNKLEEIRLKKDIPIDEFYPAIGISKSTFHLWKRGAVPQKPWFNAYLFNASEKLEQTITEYIKEGKKEL